MSWIAAEKRENKIKLELQRLKKRAQTRIFLLLALSLMSALLLVIYKLTRHKDYRASLVIRVSEGDIYRDASPLAGHKMDVYLRSVALSNTQLLKIVDSHSLFPVQRAKGDPYAIETLRDAMKISIANNYFSNGHYLSSTSRTAQVTVRFDHKNANTAFAVATDLSQAMIDNEKKRRQKVSNDILGLSTKTLAAANDHMNVVQDQIASTQVFLLSAENISDYKKVGQLKVALKSLEKRVKGLQQTITNLDIKKNNAQFILSADKADLGIRFKIVDKRAPLPHPSPNPFWVATLVFGLFLLFLPLFSILIGAFDFRIITKNDVERLGFRCLGTWSVNTKL